MVTEKKKGMWKKFMERQRKAFSDLINDFADWVFKRRRYIISGVVILVLLFSFKGCLYLGVRGDIKQLKQQQKQLISQLKKGKSSPLPTPSPKPQPTPPSPATEGEWKGWMTLKVEGVEQTNNEIKVRVSFQNISSQPVEIIAQDGANGKAILTDAVGNEVEVLKGDFKAPFEHAGTAEIKVSPQAKKSGWLIFPKVNSGEAILIYPWFSPVKLKI